MADLQHAPGPPEPALRPPGASAPELDLAPAAPRPDEVARLATGAAAGGGSASGPGRGADGAGNPHGLPRGAVGTAALLGIQRAAGNRAATALVLARRPAPAAPRLPVQRDGPQQITPSFVVPIEPTATKIDLGGKASYVRGSIALKGEVKGELVRKGQESAGMGAGGTSNVGGQTEITIAEQKGFAVFDGLDVEKVKETLSFELSKKKLDVSLGGEATIKTRYPWLKGLVGLKLVLAGIEWEEMAKDPGSAVALGVEISGGVSGEGRVNVTSEYDVLLTVKVVATGEAHPNWPRIAGEVGKRVATEGGKAAVEATTTAAGTSVVAIDMAAVASAAAVILIPLAAAIAMGYGAWQGMKNAKAARDAAGYGVVARKKAEECARGFARTLTGSAPGSDEGSAEAEAQIQAAMASTHASREMVVAAATQEQGGYQAIHDKNLKRIKDRIYADLVAKWEEQSKPDWGWLEELGPDWGMRGVFRSTFRIVLYGEG
ncbi:MAG: hypothetical protein M0T75_04060 [Chloroflexi bacterium]|nr:hypothetical protein [Chloroflexota bacterium]